MKWEAARFITTKTRVEDLPTRHHSSEVALIGRSNAGKSSFLNTLTSNSSLAKISKTPGKTRHLNLFYVGDHLSIVDMPGYGYAKRSKQELSTWNDYISSYFQKRTSLKLLVLIMDCRRKIEEEEQMIFSLGQALQVPIFLILNKCDKLNQSELHSALQSIQKDAEDAVLAILPLSCRTGRGIDAARKAIDHYMTHGGHHALSS